MLRFVYFPKRKKIEQLLELPKTKSVRQLFEYPKIELKNCLAVFFVFPGTEMVEQLFV